MNRNLQIFLLGFCIAIIFYGCVTSSEKKSKTPQADSSWKNIFAPDTGITEIKSETSDVEIKIPEVTVKRGDISKYSEVHEQFRRYLNEYSPKWLNNIDIDQGLKTRSEFEKAAKKSLKRGDIDGYIRYFTEIIKRFPVDSKSFVSSTITIIRGLSKTGQHGDFLSFVISLTDQFPNNNLYYEGRCALADQYFKGKRYEDALAIYQEMLSGKRHSKSHEFQIRKKIALIYEATGKYNDAIELYQKMKRFSANQGDFQNLLQRSIYLHLLSGNLSEAFSLVEKMSNLDINILNSLDSPAQIKELITLSADNEAMINYWERQKKWFSKWVALRGKICALFGVTINNHDVPVITNKGRVFNLKNEPEAYLNNLDLIANAARWHPSKLPSLAMLLRENSVYMQSLIEDINKFNRELLGGFQPYDKELRKKKDYLLLQTSFDLNDTETTLRLANEYIMKYDQFDVLGQSATRIWARLALKTGRNLKDTEYFLRKQLVRGTRDGHKLESILLLSDIYRKMDQTDKEVALLKESIVDTDIGSSETRKQLKARLNKITTYKKKNSSFSNGVEAWIKETQLEWFDYAFPESLAAVSTKGTEKLTRHELIKLNLLKAVEPNLPYTTKLDCFSSAISEYSLTVTNKKSVYRAYDLLLKSGSFAQDAKVEFLWHALVNAFINEDKARVSQLENLKLITLLTESRKEAVRNLKDADYVDILKGSNFNLQEYALKKLVNSGRFSQCEEAISQIGNPERIAYLNGILNKSKDIYKSHLARLSVLTDVKSGSNIAYYNVAKLDPAFLKSDQAAMLSVYGLKNGLYYLDDMRPWIAICKQKCSLLPKIIELTVNNCNNDLLLSKEVSDLLEAFPEALSGEKIRLLENIVKQDLYPITSSSIKLLQLENDIESGKRIDIDTLTKRNPQIHDRLQILIIKNYLAEKKYVKLKAVIDELDADTIGRADMCQAVIPALHHLGMGVEAELVKETVKRELKSLITDTWIVPDFVKVMNILKIAVLLENINVPPEWLKYQEKILENSRNLELFLQKKATL